MPSRTVRPLATLLAFLLTASASGQDAVPDTTDPASYYPLEVGNRWEYEPEVEGPDFEIYSRVSVVADTLVKGDRWFVRRSQRFRRFSEGDDFILDADTREVVRFDPTRATIIRWEGTKAVLDFPCRLDGPLGEGAPACDRYSTYQKYLGSVLIGTDRVETIKVSFDDVPPGPTFAAGIGDVGQAGEAGSPGRSLAFASVGGETYGEPIEGMHTLPDPTPPWMYFPLGVGDRWVYYEEVLTNSFRQYRRRTVTGDSAVAGRRYFVVETDTYNLTSDAPVWEQRGLDLLRYDSTTTDIVRWNGFSESEQVHVCRLGADLGTPRDWDDPRACPYYGPPFSPRLDVITIGGREYTVRSTKFPGPYPINADPPGFAAGIGEMERNAGSAYEIYRFEYASVDGFEYGTYPVAADDTPDPARLGVSIAPNPASGPVAVALTLPEAAAVTVEAFDALGRRVARTEAVLPAGAQRLNLDASAWAPGLYVVHVTTGEDTASGTVVRR